MKALHLWSLAGTLAFLTANPARPKLHPVSASNCLPGECDGSVGSVYVVHPRRIWPNQTLDEPDLPAIADHETIYSLIPQRQLEENRSIARCCKVPRRTWCSYQLAHLNWEAPINEVGRAADEARRPSLRLAMDSGWGSTR